MWYVAGSNIFGQWCCEELVINKFRAIDHARHEFGSSSQPQILQITWSYVIMLVDSDIFVCGAWNSKDKQVVKITLPADCIDLKKELAVIGNDYNLMLVNKFSNKIWLIDLATGTVVKQLKFNTEEPIKNEEKKQKLATNISKVVMMNDSCLYLTSSKSVYSGVLPSYVDTTHCKGQVCDVQCGYEHYVLLTDLGTVYTWGNGRRLQLGLGDICNVEVPTAVEALSGIKITKICTGGWHTLALSEFGDVYAWGWNDTGQLGIKCTKEEESYSLPTLVDLFENDEEIKFNVEDIGCGSRHSVIRLEDNTVWTSGCNKYGQLGFSEIESPKIRHFKKTFKCDNKSVLLYGPWTTVIVSN